MSIVNFIFGVTLIFIGIKYTISAYKHPIGDIAQNIGGYLQKSNQYTVGIGLIILGLMFIFSKVTLNVS